MSPFWGLAVPSERDGVPFSGEFCRDAADDAPEAAVGFESGPIGSNDRCYPESLVDRANAQDPLGESDVGPGGGAGEPAVASQAELGMLVTEDVLSVDVRLTFVLIDCVVLGRGIDLGVILKGPLAVANCLLGDDPPRVDVQ
jgi:hypothetical protein